MKTVNSGKRFRMMGEKTWYESHKSCDPIIRTTVEVLNSQFELEEKKITISESEFDRIMGKNCVEDSSYLPRMSINSFRYKSIKKELGF